MKAKRLFEGLMLFLILHSSFFILHCSAATLLGDLAWASDVSNNTARIETIAAYLNGDDAKVVFTNDPQRAFAPMHSFQVKTGGVWTVVWDEAEIAETNATELAKIRADINALDADKADRAWGYYDSHGGAYVPDGYTWVSSPQIAVAGGLAYQRTLVAEGEIWVLCSNGLVTETTGTTNGFFRITDDQGDTQFEIVKGDKRTVGANPATLSTTSSGGITHMHLTYNIQSAAHPKIYVCNSLVTKQWKAEDDQDCIANVVWGGASGAWTAEVYGKTQQAALFIKGEFETGGETYINNVVPVKMEYIYIGDQKYRIGTATISGNTVLTLSAVY